MEQNVPMLVHLGNALKNLGILKQEGTHGLESNLQIR